MRQSGRCVCVCGGGGGGEGEWELCRQLHRP